VNHDARAPLTSAVLMVVPWRIGGSVGRTIYAVLAGPEHEHARDDEGVLIGMMDSAALAQEAVDAHNWFLQHQREET
jgi:hypothetical protein